MSHTTVTVAIAYHSGFGHTRRLADRVALGASSVPGAKAVLAPVDTITDGLWDTLSAADAIIFGTPTYMGTASGTFHAFAEASSKVWHGRGWQDKLAAGFTISGGMSGDKLNTLQFLTVLAAQHGMNWVNLGLVPGWNLADSRDDEVNRLGFYLGLGAQVPNDVDAAGLNTGDLETAELLGARVARQALTLLAGRRALVAA
ncbi:flavodoxin family protein [Actinorhabdospora filicis]|nr:flavodoxin family protein [Actinorhabdospora filicis]